MLQVITSPAISRYDRTADITSRVKISQEMAQAINDELYEYEDELWDPSDDEAWVSRIFLLIFLSFNIL